MSSDAEEPGVGIHPTNVTPSAILGTGYALIALTSLIMICRFAKALARPKQLKLEDYLLLIAYAFFLELTIMYIVITPTLFRLAALQAGAPIYPTVIEDSLRLQIVFFVTTSSLWLSLWMVKFSLLTMYKRFLTGKHYLIAWWAIIVFSVLVLIGCIVSSWLSCSSFSAWFTGGACDTKRDHRAAVISLYFAYAVDLVTDLMVMALPLRLIWNLQMKRPQKLSIGALFCIGWVCIITATVRVIQLGHTTSNGKPSPAWLALWGIIEAGIAVIIGCSPGIYRTIRTHRPKTLPSYQYTIGYQRYFSGHGPSHSSQVRGGRDVPLSRVSAKVGTRGSVAACRYSGPSPSSSQENLAGAQEGDIVVTRRVSITVDERESVKGEEGEGGGGGKAGW